MSFSFNTTAGTSQSTSRPRLSGNNIYEVKFDGCEIQDIQGVKDASAVYKVLKLKFSNEDGTFEHTIFEPRPEDFQRRETEFKNRNGNIEKIPQPSNVENMMLLFKHAIDAINPAIAKDIDDNKRNLGANDWVGLRELVAKILNAGKGVTVKIKLLKNNKGEAIFPGYFTGLDREGKTYVRNNFIGNKVAFSTYELQKINSEVTARPTKVDTFTPDVNMPDVSDGLGDLNMDFDVTGL